MLCGTDPFPEHYRAKKYKIHDHFMTKQDFIHMMRNLPEKVSDEDIEEMFEFADTNSDGKISYEEFQIMINPPKPAEMPRPKITDFNKSSPDSNIHGCKDNSSNIKERKINGTKLKEGKNHGPESKDCKTEKEQNIKSPHSGNGKMEIKSLGPQQLSTNNIKIHNNITKNERFKTK